MFYKEGTRPQQVFPFCERESADSGHSDGQCGDIHASHEFMNVTCAYCSYQYFKEVFGENDIHVPVHWGVHPVFSRDGKGTLTHWEAKCGTVVDLEGTPVLASRSFDEITCLGCKEKI
jgi:hypothetical protein